MRCYLKYTFEAHIMPTLLPGLHAEKTSNKPSSGGHPKSWNGTTSKRVTILCTTMPYLTPHFSLPPTHGTTHTHAMSSMVASRIHLPPYMIRGLRHVTSRKLTKCLDSCLGNGCQLPSQMVETAFSHRTHCCAGRKKSPNPNATNTTAGTPRDPIASLASKIPNNIKHSSGDERRS